MTITTTRRSLMKQAAAITAASAAFGSPAVLKHATARAQSGETLQVSWAMWVLGPVDGDNLARQTILERFNIDLEMLSFERATWFDQVNTRVGGGDIPDIIYRDSSAVVTEYVDQGVLREVPYDAIASAAPNAFAAATAFTSDVWLASYRNGVNYGYPFQQPLQTRPFTGGWRKDWLDALGMSLPETLDQHTEAFQRIASEDPGGVGLAYGPGLRGKDSLHASIHAFTMAFGTTPTQWMHLDDGTLQHGATLDGARLGLEKVTQWYQDGLIDPEFLTVDGTTVNQKWANGTYSYLPGTWYSLIQGGAPYDSLKAVTPTAEIALGPAPKGPDGLYGYMNWGPITSSLTFGKDVDDTKLERILQMIEGIQTDPELAILLRYGVEGEHWTRNEFNAIVPTEAYVNPANRGALGTNFFAAASPSPEIQTLAARSDEADLYAYAEDGNVKNFVPFAGLLVPSDVRSQASEMDPIRDKWLTSFISGNEPLDNWQAFLDEWNGAGGAVMTEAVNATFPELEAIRAQIATAVGGSATPVASPAS
jgi:putative aldouronate transport system substrate-binding protein